MSAILKSGKLPMKRRMRGITLIELMVIVAVVAILGSLAVGSYRNYLIRAQRTEARMALLRIQAAQEKFFLQNNRYATDGQLTLSPPAGLGISRTTENGNYTLRLQTDSNGNRYRAVATATGGQTRDIAACRVLSIDQDGNKEPAANPECWR
ncbi:MAG: type IV pilin protein [Gammaproteobacteria bacterium]|nr:pilus assembly protein [Gammaproteobacteria bacterium]